MATLTFLGTGGGRFATIFQARATGGMYLESAGLRAHIDPGPGALLRLHDLGFNPIKTNALLVSHCHPDHYNDTEILIEAMTEGGLKNQGTLIASEAVLSGAHGLGPVVSRYHAGKPETVIEVGPDHDLMVEGTRIQTTPTDHTDPTGVGFRIHTDSGVASYTGDTAMTEEVLKAHSDTRLLILSITMPPHARLPHHMTSDDAFEFIAEVKPEMAILTHFGLKLCRMNPDAIAKRISKVVGIPTIAAQDSMRIRLGSSLEVGQAQSRRHRR